MSSNTVSEYLTKQQQCAPNSDVAKEWSTIEELYNKKLWHQLTLKLMEMIRNPDYKPLSLIELYTTFIQTFENKINSLSLVEIIALVLEQYTDPKEGVELIKRTLPKVKDNVDAQNLCKILMGKTYLEDLQDVDETKKVIEELAGQLDTQDGLSPVHGRYYLLASQYYRVRGDHAQYYRTALRYLGCIGTDGLDEAITIELQRQHAFFLGLAALLGDGIYNLGELLAHPILNSLRATENAWLIDLLYAFNAGNIKAFEGMRPQWSSIADLRAKEVFLRQKISLLCLMEMTFKRSCHSRHLSFEEIANETQLPQQEIELLVMKALSQQLVKGAIDQLANTVNLTWVQPRVLNRTQITSMIDHLNQWSLNVNKIEQLIEDNANEILI